MPKQDQLNGLEYYLNEYGVPALKAIIILVIGLILIKQIVKLITKTFKKRGLEESLSKFLVSLISWGLKILLVITVMGVVGIPMTSFVAILGAAGLSIGLALQGTLANFAGGVLQMVFRPYKVGDLIETQGELGTVKDIQIFNTVLISLDNKTIIIPNGSIMNGNITNYSTEGKIRVDLKVGISYDADIKKAKEVLLDVMKNNNVVLKEPSATVNVGELGDNAVILEVRPYTKPEHYWEVFFGILEEAKYNLDKEGIGIPYRQMDIHINNK